MTLQPSCDFPVKDVFEDNTGPHKLAQWSGTDRCFIAIAKQQENAIGVMMEQLVQNDVPETPVKFNKVARDEKKKQSMLVARDAYMQQKDELAKSRVINLG